MEIVLSVLAGIVSLALDVLALAMAIRALMSWFVDDDNALYQMLIYITEPIIIPFRMLLSHFEWVRTCPMDVAYLVTIIVISIISSALPSLLF